jgi:3-hydroxybutyryl-CoA dehydratase
VKYLEDIVPGGKFVTSRRTITDAEVAMFAGVSGDFNSLHVDDVFAREETPFGRRIVHGPLVLGISYGLRSPRDDWKILALVECQRSFRAPVFPGDTVSGAYEVLEVRASASRPGSGFVTLAVTIANQSGEVVQHGRDVLMVATRPTASDADGTMPDVASARP